MAAHEKRKIDPTKSQFLIYQTEDGTLKLDVRMEGKFAPAATVKQFLTVRYDPTLDISIDFFKAVQNKAHWAITGQTAAEIIHSNG